MKHDSSHRHFRPDELARRDPYLKPPFPQDWRDPRWPEVSVSLITYNHRKVIGRALDSILMQRVNFSYEIVVGDDCSDDGTRDILLEYQHRYPDRIVLNLHPRRYDNVAGRINNMTNLRACRGKYTATLDGDDYWTDPDKLQRQYDLLERYPEVVLSVHDTNIHLFDEQDRIVRTHRASQVIADRVPSHFFSHIDITADRLVFFHLSSMFFRTRVFGDFPADFESVIAADHYLTLLVSERGFIHYDATVRSAYNKYTWGFTQNARFSDFASRQRRQRDLLLYGRRFRAVREQRGYRSTYGTLSFKILIEALRERRHLHTIPHNFIRTLIYNPRAMTAPFVNKLKLYLPRRSGS